MNESRPLRLLSMLLIGALVLFAIATLVPENGENSGIPDSPGSIASSKTSLSQP